MGLPGTAVGLTSVGGAAVFVASNPCAVSVLTMPYVACKLLFSSISSIGTVEEIDENNNLPYVGCK